MKKTILIRLNKILSAMVGVLGLSGCVAAKYDAPIAVAMYGCPIASFSAEGTVKNDRSEPLAGVRVTAGGRRHLSEEGMGKSVTDKQGNYHIAIDAMFPADSIWLYADDSSGMYASDSVRVKVKYDGKGDGRWNMGNGKAEKDFMLKEK